MKYNVVRTIIKASKIQKVFIYLDIFLANKIAPKCFSKMMYLCHKELFNWAISKNPVKSKIKNQLSKAQKSKKLKIAQA